MNNRELKLLQTLREYAEEKISGKDMELHWDNVLHELNLFCRDGKLREY